MGLNDSSDPHPIGVIGAGSFGTAIGNLLAENAPVLLYGRNADRVEQINRERSSSGQKLHDQVTATNDISQVASSCYLIFLAVPSASFLDMLLNLSEYIRPDHVLIHGTKGLHIEFEGDIDKRSLLARKSIFTMTELIHKHTVAVKSGCLHGPNLAREISAGKPAAAVIGSKFDEVIQMGKAALRSSRFQVYGSYEIPGIELAGVFKNVLALGSGVIRGLELGENARALFLTRGLGELVHLGKQLGIEPQAFLGLAGIGDMIATCASPMSRNYTVGFRIARGEALTQIIGSLEEVAEGVQTVKVALALGNSLGMRLPITRMLYRILFEEADPGEAMQRLMAYRVNKDVDFL